MESLSNILILPAFGDNYIYLAEYAPGLCFAVDPGDSGVVEDALVRRSLQLTHIFATHHHPDHTGGIDVLKQITGCVVMGPEDNRNGSIDTVMKDGDEITLGDICARCITTPGHTATSVCYYVTGHAFSAPVLFSGDTLFVCGCGRISECDGKTMYASLQKLTTLPDDTLVYPGHDYTEENICFALTVCPDDPALLTKLKAVRNKAARRKPTVPSTLEEEKRLNVFLAAADGRSFIRLREAKNVF